jgi:hypothetical protein
MNSIYKKEKENSNKECHFTREFSNAGKKKKNIKSFEIYIKNNKKRI